MVDEREQEKRILSRSKSNAGNDIPEFSEFNSGGVFPKDNPLGISSAFLHYFKLLSDSPSRVLEIQKALFQAANELAQNFAGMEEEETARLAPLSEDRRFKSKEWRQSPYFNYFRESYLLSVDILLKSIAQVPGIDTRLQKKIEFYSVRYLESMSPSNFLLTNPDVLRATYESCGENLLKGMINFFNDYDHENGLLKTKMVDDSAFEIGRNIAVTKGSVVFQNRLMQLIQYEATGSEVFEKPLLIVPPWINKFYILDLSADNSFIGWAVSKGLTVYVISWANPDKRLEAVDFEDYGLEGFLEAVDAVIDVSQSDTLNVLGYCLGGTLLGTMLAYMQTRGDSRVNSSTFLTTMLDFSEPGDLGIFVNEENIEAIECRMSERGYLDGEDMALVFKLLRATDLIWHFYVNNYLLGKDPAAFDILFWNSDTTRLPAKMHSSYLRKMYIENCLVRPNSLSIRGVKVDLGRVLVPSCFVSAVDDHIAPWRSTLAGARLLGAESRFILTEGGHVAGIVNPPRENAYPHRLIEIDTPIDEFLTDVDTNKRKYEYSWWLNWFDWLEERSGRKLAAKPIESGRILEEAPGNYVKKQVI